MTFSTTKSKETGFTQDQIIIIASCRIYVYFMLVFPQETVSIPKEMLLWLQCYHEHAVKRTMWRVGTKDVAYGILNQDNAWTGCIAVKRP